MFFSSPPLALLNPHFLSQEGFFTHADHKKQFIRASPYGVAVYRDVVAHIVVGLCKLTLDCEKVIYSGAFNFNPDLFLSLLRHYVVALGGVGAFWKVGGLANDARHVIRYPLNPRFLSC